MKLLRGLQAAQMLLKPSIKFEKKKIIVIGGGFSGLSVAYNLKDSLHYSVEILEARDRLGGRVFPYDLDGTMVDLGGQWVHEASERNPIRQLMDELTLPFVEKPLVEEGNTLHQVFSNLGVRRVFDSDGKPIDMQTRESAEDFFHTTLTQDFLVNDANSDTSVQNLLDTALNSSQIIKTDTFMQMLNYLGHWSECYEGGRLRELSASLYREALYENLGGDDEVPKGTYLEVIKAVVGKIGADKIRLECVVDSVNFSSSPIDGKVTITLENGELISGDYCVCTVPLGVLQKRKIRFSPALPDTRWRSIDSIGMGLLDKIALKFDYCFWEHDSFSSAHVDPSRIKIFYDASNDVGAPVLFMYHGGDAARRVDSRNGLNDEEAVEETMEALRSIFGNDIPNPMATAVTRWDMDPFSFGAYSFAKVGSTAKDYEEVASPLGNLFFAGEHTNKVAHSCVHGAWATGQREARRLQGMATEAIS